MMMKIKELLLKYKEIIVYLVFGVLTTVVNFLAFWIFSKLLGEELYLLNNAIAWVVSVVFAFVTNKLFVFESKSWALKTAGKELVEFVGARLFSFGIEEGGMWLFIDLLNFGEKGITIFGISITGQMIVKLILAVIVVILNYFFSKFIIFKNKNKK
jgi:putative flippase GtrA